MLICKNKSTTCFFYKHHCACACVRACVRTCARAHIDVDRINFTSINEIIVIQMFILNDYDEI